MAHCKHCKAPMLPLFSSVVCSADCHVVLAFERGWVACTSQFTYDVPFLVYRKPRPCCLQAPDDGAAWAVEFLGADGFKWIDSPDGSAQVLNSELLLQPQEALLLPGTARLTGDYWAYF